MKKILYAIQQKAAENYLTETLAPSSIVPAGNAAYREAVLPALREAPADLLVYRESLKGSTDTFELMLSIRREFPLVRVIFIANEQPATSTLLCKLVCLGIYDIINSNNPNVSDIADFIIHPRDFGFADKFFQPRISDELVAQALIPSGDIPAPATEQKGRGSPFGFLSKLRGNSITSAEEPALASAPAPALPEMPKVDTETMRRAMLEEARRVAQAEIPALVNIQVDMATASLKSDLAQRNATVSELRHDLKQKTDEALALRQQLDEAGELRKTLESRMLAYQQEASQVAIQYQTQLATLQTTKPPEWYHDQTRKWLAEREHYLQEISDLSTKVESSNVQLQTALAENKALSLTLESKDREIETLQLALPRDIIDAVDDTLEDDFVVIPDLDCELKPAPYGEGRLIAFMGTKHGVGNTTVALNTAIALANCGYKTCYIELNRQFPLVNEFFEFSNIVRGLDTAIKACQQGNPRLASMCIIKPHGIQTSKKSMQKIYQRLPGPLHFLLYSNEFLLQCKSKPMPGISEQDLRDLSFFLTMQERYSFVVVDLQPDDQDALNTFLQSSNHVHQLVMTMSQDPHSITTAQYMITRLARSRGNSLLQNTQFVVNQYSSGNKMSATRVCEYLHIPRGRLSKISLDSRGYMDASYAMVPYLLSKGKFSNEYIDLRMKLSK